MISYPFPASLRPARRKPRFPVIPGVLWLVLLVAGLQAARAGAAPVSRIPWIGRELGLTQVRFAMRDTIEIVAHRYRPLMRPWPSPPLSYLAAAPAPQYYRSLAFSALTHRRTYERPRIARAICGAGQLTGTAAAVGGLGLVGGLWGDKTAAYLMGAGAVLGTLWGGTLGAETPGIRIGVDPGPLGPEAGWHSSGIVRRGRSG
jgi:hypothetical protein